LTHAGSRARAWLLVVGWHPSAFSSQPDTKVVADAPLRGSVWGRAFESVESATDRLTLVVEGWPDQSCLAVDNLALDLAEAPSRRGNRGVDAVYVDGGALDDSAVDGLEGSPVGAPEAGQVVETLLCSVASLLGSLELSFEVGELAAQIGGNPLGWWLGSRGGAFSSVVGGHALGAGLADGISHGVVLFAHGFGVVAVGGSVVVDGEVEVVAASAA
jgi:hypothetical protein